MVMLSPTSLPRIASPREPTLPVDEPLMPRSWAPGVTPAAAAGESGVTRSTVVVRVDCEVPIQNVTANSRNARRMFTAGPARITKIRFQGEVGEQATMFFLDPAGNALEFKSFRDPAQLFATD